MTTVVFWYGPERVTQKISAALTAQLVMASHLLVATNFTKTLNGEMTIIDIQILANMFFVLLLVTLSLVEWGSCIDIIRSKLRFIVDDDTLNRSECETLPGMFIFIFCAFGMLSLNLILTFNVGNSATRMRSWIGGRQNKLPLNPSNGHLAVFCNTREKREKWEGLKFDVAAHVDATRGTGHR